MPDNVVYPAFVTTLDLPPDRILEAAVGHLKGVIVLGYTDGGEPYFASSYGSTADNLLLAERFKQMLLEQ